MRVLPNWLNPSENTSQYEQSEAPVRIRPLFDITEPFVPQHTTAISNVANSSHEYMDIQVCSPQRFLNEDEPDPQEITLPMMSNNTNAEILLTNESVIVRTDQAISSTATTSLDPQQSEACSSSGGTVEVPRPFRIKTEIKEEPSGNVDCPSAATATSSTNATAKAIKTEVKSEPADSSTPARQSCTYGIRCYRRTADHRAQEAHPGDADYRRPVFPPATPGSPDCPFGANCYRRNPDHFQRLNHPPSCIYNPNPIIPATVQQPTAPASKRKTTNPPSNHQTAAKRTRNVYVTTFVGNISSDDEDEDFINDDSSDDFDPTKHTADTDDDDTDGDTGTGTNFVC